MADALLGLGSNLGDPERNLRRALDALERVWRPAAVSSLWRTEPVGFVDQDWFLNIAALGETELEPIELLGEIGRIEADLGRERTITNGPRTVDIDILLWDDLATESEGPRIPHPRMHRRRFVLAPAAEIAPDRIHPTLGRTLAEMLKDLDDEARVERLTAGSWPPSIVR